MTTATRVLTRFLTAMQDRDWMVKDPELKPSPLAKRYVKELQRIGVGTRVEVVRSVADIPRGWDYRIYTVLQITPRHGEKLKAAITLNVAEGQEASGTVQLDAPYGVITVPRGKPEQVIDWMMAEAVDRLKR